MEYHPGWLYDKIYSFKDYTSEASYLHQLIQKLHPSAQTLLDLSCGTGQHLFHLKHHYRAEGLDLSEKLLETARARNPELAFHQGDMCNFSLGKRFDVITCLFSAIGYAGSPEGLENAIEQMARHMNLGGVLLVEPWFSPEQWNHGQCDITVVDEPELKIARLNTSRKEGRLSILDFHYLVATPQGVSYFTKCYQPYLFTPQEYLGAFEKAGLLVEYDPTGITGRGLYIGRLEPG